MTFQLLPVSKIVITMACLTPVITAPVQSTRINMTVISMESVMPVITALEFLTATRTIEITTGLVTYVTRVPTTILIPVLSNTYRQVQNVETVFSSLVNPVTMEIHNLVTGVLLLVILNDATFAVVNPVDVFGSAGRAAFRITRALIALRLCVLANLEHHNTEALNALTQTSVLHQIPIPKPMTTKPTTTLFNNQSEMDKVHRGKT
jgi:hypothetical protein